MVVKVDIIDSLIQNEYLVLDGTIKEINISLLKSLAA